MRSKASIATAAYLCFAGPSLAAPVTVAGIYEERVPISCTSGSNCVVRFSLLNAPLVVKKVSCNYYYPPQTVVTGVALSKADSAGTFVAGNFLRYLVWQPQAVTATYEQDQLLQDTLSALPTGVYPAIQVSYAPDSALRGNCTISGTQ